MSVLAIVSLVALVALLVIAWRLTSRYRAGNNDEVFARARASEPDALSRFFIDASKPFSGLPVVSDNNSIIYQSLSRLLMAAGGAYGGSVEVFISAMVLSTLAGVAVLLLTAAGLFTVLLGMEPGLVSTGLGVLVATGIAGIPYASVSRRARKRTAEIDKGLPEFAELLQMPLTAGISVMAALEFTARNTQGPVSNEAQNVVLLTRTRTVTDAEAFALAGKRLGTPEAVAFFNALSQAHVEGAKVVEVIGRQAKSLRQAQYQRQRETLKKLPIKLIVIFALHFLPAMFVLILFTFAGAFRSL